MSRFSIPCLSVAVEEGQPEQAPFIVRYTTPSLKPLKMISPPSPATAGRTRVSISSLIASTVSEILRVEELAGRNCVGAAGRDQGLSRKKEFGHHAEYCRPQMLPFALALGHRNEVVGEEHAGDPGQLHQRLGERRALCFGRVARLECAVLHHQAARQKFQRRGIGGGFGLDEHGGPGLLCPCKIGGRGPGSKEPKAPIAKAPKSQAEDICPRRGSCWHSKYRLTRPIEL